MRRMKHYIAGALLGLVVLAGGVRAAEPLPPEFKAAGNWMERLEMGYDYGGDVRVRGVYFDDIPIIADPPGVTRGGDNHFYRFRTRLWGDVNLKTNTAVRIRITNEFRHYEKPDNDTWDALDEIVVDNLYLDLNKCFNGKVDFRIGRQDLVYGTGKLILEGTPKDGSRTIYSDAVKASYTGLDDMTIDLFGIYNQPENDLVLNSEDRDLTGVDSGFNDLTESGAGVYLKSKAYEELPFEAYYIYKHESDWVDRTGTNEFPRNFINTIGARFMPKPNEQFDANVELAYQFGETGDEDMTGYMIDAVGRWHLPVAPERKPCLGLGWYYLSGDDPDTADDEGWNPLWARWPQYSELYIYSWDAERAGQWSNLNMPYVEFTVIPTEKVLSKLMLGYMWAPEDDGPGDGDARGFLAVFRNDFVLAEKVLGKKDKLFGHLLFEILEPGDYYDVGNTAYFARWEFSYAF